MNKHILVAMDHENLSKEELKKNLDAAHDAAVAVRADYAATAADFAADFAYFAAAAAADSDSAKLKYWINNYFNVTGENREDYEKALEKGRR